MTEQDPSTAVATREAAHPAVASGPSVPGMMSPDEIQAAYRVAAALAQSGLYKDVHSAEQAFAKIVVGRSLGLNEAQSLSLYAMEGKIEVPATMMAGWVRQHGLEYDVTWQRTEAGDALGCTVTIFDGDRERGESEFTLSDAERAGLIKPKSAWDKFPRNMLFARAMSNAVRWYAPEILGGLPVYTEGEIERVANLAEGEGDGSEPGWGSTPIAAVHEAEKIIRRATKLGHAGLQSRAAIQMMLSGQPDDTVRRWLQESWSELDELQAKQQVERGEPTAEDVEHGQGEALAPEDDDVSSRCGRDLDPGLGCEACADDEAAAASAQGAPTDEPPAPAPADTDLPPQTQLALAEARLGAAQNDREEQAARAEVERLKGEQ